MDFSLKQLKVLHAIKTSGSIAKAQKLTGMSQPGISHHLSKLEERFGMQLLKRGRGVETELTPEGYYWADIAQRILLTLDEAEKKFSDEFLNNDLAITFGVTPSFRGRFSEVVSMVASQLNNLRYFEISVEKDSETLVASLNNHLIDMAVVSESSVIGHEHSYYLEPLFNDKVLWALPQSVSDQEILEVLNCPSKKQIEFPIKKYVEVSGIQTWNVLTRNWYSQNIHNSKPFFRTGNYPTALEIVSGGFATCHAPSITVPYISDIFKSKLKFVDINLHSRKAVLAMPKHLRSIPIFKNFFDLLVQIIKSDVALVDRSFGIKKIHEI